MPESKRTKMAKTLCKYIAWYEENNEDSYYHFYMGYLQAMRDIGIKVEIYRNEFVYIDDMETPNMFRVKDYKDAQSDLS